MIFGFHDVDGHSFHMDFQRWRQSHLDGYFLAFKTRTRTILHMSECKHPGGVEWNGIEHRGGRDVQTSLTSHRKVCSSDQAELLSWADNEGVEYKPCSHCIDTPLTKRRTASFDYIEQAVPPKLSGKAKRTNAESELRKRLEGISQEAVISTKSRNAALRREAMDRANGVCEACEFDFSGFAGGRGVRVLQAHHREQLALNDAPVWNDSDDLAILCANCHLLIHHDMKKAMSVEELRELLHSS